ncbi:MAG: hypothetical protein XFASWVDF_000032 [Candidatus Fervidibacter sp.]
MQRAITFSLVLAAFVGTVAIGIWQMRRHLPTPTELAAMLQRELTQQLKVPVRIGRVEVGWWGATVHQVHILPDRRSPTGYLLTVPKLRLHWSWQLLLSPSHWRQAIRQQLTEAVQQVLVADARLFLWRDRKGRWNANPLLSARPSKRQRLPIVTFRRSELVLSDEMFPLPDGTPFRLRLLDAEGEWRQDANGSVLRLQGKIAAPLGTEKSAAKVIIVERVGERWRETEGRLHFTGLQANRLPERLRRWFDGRLTVQRGDLAEGEIYWAQQGKRWQVRFTLLGQQLVADWRQNRRATSLRLREVTLRGALRMDRQRVKAWQVTFRWRPQPLLGEGQLAAEGNPTGWRMRWRGEQMAATWLASIASNFGLASLPLTKGLLSGTAMAEGRGRAWRVETEWTGEGVGWKAQSFAPFVNRITAAFPFVHRHLAIASVTSLSSVQRMQLTARMEGVGRVGEGKEQGAVNFSAVWGRPTEGELSLTAVWQDGQGRAEGRVRNFPLGQATFRLPVQDKPLQGRWVGGFVSGEGIVRWHTRRLRLERLALQLTDSIVQGEHFAPMRVAFSLRANDNRIAIPKAQLRWQGGAMATGGGEILAGRPMVWQVEGTLSSSAVTSLSAWLRQRWALPLQLFASGSLRAKGRGVGRQWLAEGQWTAPQGTVTGAQRRQQGQWGFGAEKLNAFVAPQGAIVWGRLAQLTPPSHAVFASSALRLSDWQLQWDAKGQQVTASGTVFVPSVTVWQVPLRDVKGQVEVTVRTDGQGWQLRAQNLSGEGLQGKLTDGQWLAWGDKTGQWRVAGKGQAKGIWLSEIQRLRLPISLTVRGKFTGRWQAQGSPDELRLAFTGDIADAFVTSKDLTSRQSPIASRFTFFAQQVQGLNAAVIAIRQRNGWQVGKVMGEATLRGVQVTTKGEEWQAERLVVQGVAERKADDGEWRFDGRLLQGRWLGGQINGQLAMDGTRWQGHVSFTALDGERLWRFIAPFVAPDRHSNPSPVANRQSLPLKGRVGGWLRFQLVRQNPSRQSPVPSPQSVTEGWQGEWEGALSLADGAVGGWAVKLAGVRAQGQLVAETQQGQLVRWQTQGEVDGIHVLSPDGQAVLSGTFALTSHPSSIAFRCRLQGRWGMVSLRRLAERLGLPKPMQGVAEGTVSIYWDAGRGTGDGEWDAGRGARGEEKAKNPSSVASQPLPVTLRVEGTAKVPAVVIGDGVRLTEVTGEWAWQPNTLRLQRVKAQADGGTLTAEGTFGTVKPFPLTLRVESDGISSSVLRAALREWRLPMGDLEWRGRVRGTVWVYRDERRQQVTGAVKSESVVIGEASLGSVHVDFRAQRDEPDGAWQVAGQGSAQRDGMVAQIEWDGTMPKWRVAWRAGKVPLEAVRAIVRALPKVPERWQEWLRLPITGEVWAKGEGQGEGSKVVAWRSEFFAPRLWGVGEEPLSVQGNLAFDGTKWLLRPLTIRQERAEVSGWLAVGEKEALEGEWIFAGVRRATVIGILRLLGMKDLPSLPNGVLRGQWRLAGTLRQPEGTGSLQATEVRWGGWRLPELVIRRFVLDGERVRIQEGDGEIRFNGEAPSASFWGEWQVKDGGALQVHLVLPRIPLKALLPPEAGVQVEGGWVQGRWDLTGTTEKPRLTGALEGEASAITLFVPDGEKPTSRQSLFASRFRFRDVRWRLIADGATVRLVEAIAHLNGGTVTASGTLTVREGGWQNPFANEGEITLNAQKLQTSWNGTTVALKQGSWRLRLSDRTLTVRIEEAIGNGWSAKGQVRWGEKVWQEAQKNAWQWLAKGNWDVALRLERFRWQAEGAVGHLTGTLHLVSSANADAPLLSGDLTVSEGTISRLAIGRGGTGRWEYPPALRFAVNLRVGEGFFLRNPQASVLLSGSAQLTGTLTQPRLEGEIQGRAGTIRLPASVLTLTEMSFPFTAFVDPLSKTWQWTARLRVEGETQMDIHRIIFLVAGPVDEPSQRLGILPTVTVLATPPLPERTLLERLFGASLAQLSQVLTDWQQLFSGALVQSFMGELLAPVTTPIAEASRLSELSLVREQTTGQRWLRLGFPLSPRLHVLWRQGLSATDPSAIEVQYFLGKRTSITWVKRERERAEIRLQTSIRF